MKLEDPKSSPVERSIMFSILFSLIYILFRVVPTDVIFVAALALGAFVFVVRLKWIKLRQKGLVNLLSPKLRDALLHKSIFDIYCDIIYFPLISEIIKAFIVPAVTKPTPDRIFGSFSELPPKIRDAIATKGILHLAPEGVERLMLKENWTVAHEEYGKVDPTWYNNKLYEKVLVAKPPKLTIKHRITDRVFAAKWHYVLAASLALMFIGKRFSNIQLTQLLLRRGFEIGVVLFAVSLYFTFKKLKRAEHQKAVEPKLSTSVSSSILRLSHSDHSEGHMTRGASKLLSKAISAAETEVAND